MVDNLSEEGTESVVTNGETEVNQRELDICLRRYLHGGECPKRNHINSGRTPQRRGDGIGWQPLERRSGGKNATIGLGQRQIL